jgi:hypothetical protein
MCRFDESVRLRTQPAAALAILALALAPPAAAAEPALVPFPFGDAYGDESGARAIQSDGHRFLVWRQARDAHRIFDEDTRQVRDVQTPPNCGVVDAAPNIALVHCAGEGSLNPHLLYLRSGALVPARRREDLESHHGYREIGRHWIRGGYTSPTTQKPVDAYLNWRTGELRASYEGAFDLDDPGLAPRPNGVVAREGDYTLRTPGRSGGRTLVLDRARHGRVSLSKCPREPDCLAPSLSAGIVTWSEQGGLVRAYDARRRRFFEWHPRGSEFFGTLYVTHTRRRVLTYAGAGPVWARIRK